MDKIFFTIKVLSLIGIVLAVYLLWEQVSGTSFQPCYVNSVINCNAVISGAVSKTLGIPTPVYGLIGYIVIFLSAVLGKKKLLLSVAAFGLGFCLWIGYQELFLLHTICPVCIICEILMISVFSLSVVLIRYHESQNEKQ